MRNASRKKLVEMEAILMKRIFTDAPGMPSTLGISFGISLFQRRLQINLCGKCKETESQVEIFHILWPFGLILAQN